MSWVGLQVLCAMQAGMLELNRTESRYQVVYAAINWGESGGMMLDMHQSLSFALQPWSAASVWAAYGFGTMCGLGAVLCGAKPVCRRPFGLIVRCAWATLPLGSLLA